MVIVLPAACIFGEQFILFSNSKNKEYKSSQMWQFLMLERVECKIRGEKKWWYHRSLDL